MKFTAVSVLAVPFALALLVGGGVASAECTPGGEPVPVVSTIGTSPVVDAPGADAMPSLLGTVFRLQWTHVDSTVGDSQYEFLVQPTSVTTVDMTDVSRLVRIAVKFNVVAGSAVIDPADFFLIDTDGVRYSPVTSAIGGLVEQMIKTVSVPEQGITEWAIDVPVPLSSRGLLIGYDPSPVDELVGTWTLSAP